MLVFHLLQIGKFVQELLLPKGLTRGKGSPVVRLLDFSSSGTTQF
jgi:hypothetical protein